MDQYGLIGYPLKHSFSKGYFNDKFSDEKIDAEYLNFEIPSIKEFPSILKEHPNLKGLNVTIPYKEQVIPYLDQLSENAKLIGAVNVIKIERSKGKVKKTTGFNSDIIGFKQSIEPLLQPHHQQALVLGTGGAAKAIYYGLKQLGLIPTYVSREKISENGLTYNELTAHDMTSNTVIVNCTPVGMWPHVDDYPKIPYEYVTCQHLLYDLLYNPDETMFMKLGKEQGATVKNGLEMLLLQAFAGWNFWQS
ncbi:shikimate 5-dehydrogenase [Bacteroidia bacterium]|nr:shikimate 5-dehydrogenase [Bacteroidia bacterium]GHT03843.1 shikimate 5-dehydrogenase [Bacteroidia bacterium]GHT49840.1 shikimate 5-dehydrogenase [Bacteroidia bacterium]